MCRPLGLPTVKNEQEEDLSEGGVIHAKFLWENNIGQMNCFSQIFLHFQIEEKDDPIAWAMARVFH